MAQILGIQIIGIVLSGIIFYQAWALYKKGKFKPRDFLIWGVISVLFLAISAFPGIANYVLGLLKIKRALDAILIIGIFGAYALIFQTYIRIQQTNREVTELVRKVALKFEESKKKVK